eukprot:829247-Prorocentrum_minimum.AAC.2
MTDTAEVYEMCNTSGPMGRSCARGTTRRKTNAAKQRAQQHPQSTHIANKQPRIRKPSKHPKRVGRLVSESRRQVIAVRRPVTLKLAFEVHSMAGRSNSSHNSESPLQMIDVRGLVVGTCRFVVVAVVGPCYRLRCTT